MKRVLVDHIEADRECSEDHRQGHVPQVYRVRIHPHSAYRPNYYTRSCARLFLINRKQEKYSKADVQQCESKSVDEWVRRFENQHRRQSQYPQKADREAPGRAHHLAQHVVMEIVQVGEQHSKQTEYFEISLQ